MTCTGKHLCRPCGACEAELAAARRDMSARAMTRRYAEALIAIVAQPYLAHVFVHVDGSPKSVTMLCPACDDAEGHHADCPWLIAARALGVA